MCLPLNMRERVSSFGLTHEGGVPIFLSKLVDVHIAAFYLSFVNSPVLELDQYLGAFWTGADERGKEMPGSYLQGVSVWMGTQRQTYLEKHTARLCGIRNKCCTM